MGFRLVVPTVCTSHKICLPCPFQVFPFRVFQLPFVYVIHATAGFPDLNSSSSSSSSHSNSNSHSSSNSNSISHSCSQSMCSCLSGSFFHMAFACLQVSGAGMEESAGTSLLLESFAHVLFRCGFRGYGSPAHLLREARPRVLLSMQPEQNNCQNNGSQASGNWSGSANGRCCRNGGRVEWNENLEQKGGARN